MQITILIAGYPFLSPWIHPAESPSSSQLPDEWEGRKQGHFILILALRPVLLMRISQPGFLDPLLSQRGFHFPEGTLPEGTVKEPNDGMLIPLVTHLNSENRMPVLQLFLENLLVFTMLLSREGSQVEDLLRTAGCGV